MPIEWKKGTDGQPVIKDGKAVLFDTDTQAVYEVDPAAIHARNLQLRADLPARNAEIDTLKAQLAAFDKIKATHADLLDKPQEVAAKLKKLADLEASSGGKTVDEQVAAVRAETAAAVEKMRADHAAELTAREETIKKMEEEAALDKLLIPWMTDPILKGLKIPADRESLVFHLLGGEWKGKIKIEKDGEKVKVYGPDGLPMQDSSPGAVLKYLAENHPQRASWKLSTMPEGVNIGGTGGGGTDDAEKYFKPDGFNLTKQLELQNSNPALYQQLSAKYS